MLVSDSPVFIILSYNALICDAIRFEICLQNSDPHTVDKYSV